MGNPKNPATNQAVVQVVVNRNNFPPEFLNTPYGASINSNSPNGTLIASVSWRDNDTVVREIFGFSA
ncbi:hypothetical protein DPMN_025794 [Dreissena polymorpha]|uniref:Uncharacterized protein n=1 Tax=Dreissena polymorpha TaxID=45954 RepID=A0A9D4LS56_DREPO|nr:hypothetical protein DPMN_025794 [Dreissena polymorpha]